MSSCPPLLSYYDPFHNTTYLIHLTLQRLTMCKLTITVDGPRGNLSVCMLHSYFSMYLCMCMHTVHFCD
eukprot:m.367901 g.367901  ORF g.367901 m.367901 type:complete len:69 (-) comp42803_c0_seq1:23-229(-)